MIYKCLYTEEVMPFPPNFQNQIPKAIEGALSGSPDPRNLNISLHPAIPEENSGT